MNSWWRRFSSENILISVGLHLLIAAGLITSIAVVVDRAELVAPDRIQIIDIDLNAIKISVDKTVLYNTDTPDVQPEPVKTEPDEPEPAPEPDDVAEQEITAPSLVEDKPVEKPQPEKPVAEPEQKPEQDTPPAPKKKTVVRVNRDVVSLDRTLTAAVADALRAAMTRCWVIDTSRPDLADIRAVAHLTMRRNATVADVWFESAAREQTDPAFAYVLDTIRTAINVCQPLKILLQVDYKYWEKIQLTFYPTQGKVM